MSFNIETAAKGLNNHRNFAHSGKDNGSDEDET